MNKKILNKPEISNEQLATAMQNAVSQTRQNIPQFGNKLMTSCSTDNFYEIGENVGWTTGFWPGELWLAYELTGEEQFKSAGLNLVENFLYRMENKIYTDTHDMGFLYTLSCISAHKLTGSENAKKAALIAADFLRMRFHEKGQFLQAWGKIGAPNNYRMIIDCMMNLPLLYWATEQTGDESYSQAAKAHCDTALDVIIRPDGSTHHTYFFDMETGAPLRGVTAQGYDSNSAWSRGQSWGVYGIALAYKQNLNPDYIPLFEQVTDFFIEHLPENLVPYWDFHFTTGSDEPWDSSAAAIAVCGMLEMSKYLPVEKAEYYTSCAKKILGALVEHCGVSDFTKSNGLLLHGTYCRSSEFNEHDDRGVDECSGWGDYFYMEALTRLSKDWQLYW